jgi:hypothetical protein
MGKQYIKEFQIIDDNLSVTGDFVSNNNVYAGANAYVVNTLTATNIQAGCFQANNLDVGNNLTVGGNITGGDSLLITNGITGSNIFIRGNSDSCNYICGDLTITGKLTALGAASFVNTVFSTTSAICVFNTGLGPAMYIQQGAGPGDIASFYDADGLEVLHVGNAKNTSGQDPNGVVGIKTSYPNSTLSVNGQISANNNVYSSGSLYTMGSLGVGTYAPSVKAEILGDILASSGVATNIKAQTTTSESSLFLTRSGAAANQKQWQAVHLNNGEFRIRSVNDAYTSEGSVLIATRGANEAIASTQLWAGGVNRVHIKSDGCIGINNTAPAYNLDICGTLRATSNLVTGGTLSVACNSSVGGNFLVSGSSTVTGCSTICSNSTVVGTSTVCNNFTTFGTGTICGIATLKCDLNVTGAINGCSTVCGTTITATTEFKGKGLCLTDTCATNITSGTLAKERLATSGVTAATYGSASNVSAVTVDTYGRVTGACNVSICIAGECVNSGTINNARLPSTISVACVSGSCCVSGGAISGSTISATTEFKGKGLCITDTCATNITSGTLNNARLPADISVTSVGTTGAVSAGTTVCGTTITASVEFKGKGLCITDTCATNITSGTLNNARLPGAISVTSVSTTGAVSAGTTVCGTTITASTEFNGKGLCVTDLCATNITSGTLNNARLPADISVTSVAGCGPSLTNLNACNIATGTLAKERLATSGVTAATYGSASNVSAVTVDTYGRVTGACNVAIAIAASAVTSGQFDTARLPNDITVSGTIKAGGDVWAYNTSDCRLKTNIQSISDSLNKLSKINGVCFDWNGVLDTHSGSDIGVIAQEVEEVLPLIVTTRDNGYKAVRYEKIIPLLIEAIKELKSDVDILKKSIH